MQNQINTLAEKVASLSAVQKANHEQNRSDIHRLANGQQTLIDTLTVGLEKISDKITAAMEKRFVPLEGNVLKLQLQWAKATGYVIGLSTLGGLIFEFARIGLAKLLGH